MQYLVNSRQMKEYDGNTIREIGIPSLVLMERAAAATAEEICKRFLPQRTLVLAGCGNNGGDGFAAGRILQEYGYPVTFCLIGERKKCSEETNTQIQILETLGNEICVGLPEREIEPFGVILDALFGIGLSRALSDTFLKAVEYINLSGAHVVSVDIPSGIMADTGEVAGDAVKAELTVTYAYPKLGHYFYPGANYTGELICRKIGISYRKGWEKPEAFCYEKADIAGIPARSRDGNKGSFGKVLVIAGSQKMYGACQFAALGAYRIGAGLVRVLTTEENRELLLKAVPEAIVDTYGADEFPEEMLQMAMNWANCIVIGPGLGTSKTAEQILKYVWKHAAVPLVVDADGLNLLAEWEDAPEPKMPVYLTPHLMEFSRLTKKSIKCCKEERIETVKKYAAQHGVIMVSKDARTIVADQKGAVYFNLSGDDGMATGGSGDVLAGILGGLLGQGMQGISAAAMAVYLHGLAGNAASAKKTTYSVMAGDLLDELPEILTRGGK